MRLTEIFGATRSLAATGILMLGLVPATLQAQTAEDDNLVVTLLGTGTPTLQPDRYSSANLVQAGGLNLLFDAGRGASIRLGQMGQTPGTLDAVFLTHFHSDHVNGLADIFTTGYIVGATLKGRTEPMDLYGPVGTQELANGLLLAHRWDMDTRIVDEGTPEAATQINVFEAEQGVVFDQNGVKVTAFSVDHGDNITHALGYRVDYKGKSVVISGDTTYDETVIEQAKGVDLLIHETGLATPELMERPAVQKIMAHHTSPEEVGRVFEQAAPKLAVYTHMVLLGGRLVDEVIAQTRRHYDGPLVIGEDLMQFILTDSGPTVLIAGR